MTKNIYKLMKKVKLQDREISSIFSKKNYKNTSFRTSYPNFLKIQISIFFIIYLEVSKKALKMYRFINLLREDLSKGKIFFFHKNFCDK